MNPSALLYSLLENLSHLPEFSELQGEALSGHCDAFALALSEYLKVQGVEHEFMVIERVRRDRKGNQVEHNALSHVVVMTPQDGTCWDIEGQEADERWEENWIQPADDPENRRDAWARGCEDTFQYRRVTREELIALRQHIDGCEPNPTMKAAFAKAIEQASSLTKPTKAPSVCGPRL